MCEAWRGVITAVCTHAGLAEEDALQADPYGCGGLWERFQVQWQTHPQVDPALPFCMQLPAHTTVTQTSCAQLQWSCCSSTRLRSAVWQLTAKPSSQLFCFCKQGWACDACLLTVTDTRHCTCSIATLNTQQHSMHLLVCCKPACNSTPILQDRALAGCNGINAELLGAS